MEGAGARAQIYSVAFDQSGLPGDVLTNSRVCLKLVTVFFGETLEHNVRVLRKILRGVKLWSSLKHPNINPCYGWTFEFPRNEPHFGIVSQFCPHYNAPRYLLKYPEANREKMVCEVARGLRYLHDDAGIVHGDVKPRNVLVSDEGVAMLSDFGQAEILDLAPINLRDAGRFLTLEYWAPEVFPKVFPATDGDNILYRSMPGDVWSFGCTLLEILFGVAPYSGVHRHHVICALITGQPPFKEVDTTTIFGDVAQRCLTFDADKRLPMAEAVTMLDPPKASAPPMTLASFAG
ncbi:kinase-like domain-containing protein [Cantharellus anzutake]|uniref:kinase-like domain-containing protein n=1 Tax=Cantharellus anzutake TaxID=1750568 RepID=UPI00190417B0|nr:kinase-like domain-containing protein [Cantharellus anzutake]KAF8341224.1 kinase-like domain-containing protein [Cantharellus anzutake]